MISSETLSVRGAAPAGLGLGLGLGAPPAGDAFALEAPPAPLRPPL